MSKKLFKDTFYFFKNNFFEIFILIISTTFISILLNLIFSSENEKFFTSIKENLQVHDLKNLNLISFLKRISYQEKVLFLKFFLINMTINLIGNSYLISNLLVFIKLISKKKYQGFTKCFIFSLYFFPKIFFLVLLTTIFIQIGLLLTNIPSILISIFFILTPIITVEDDLNILETIKKSAELIFSNIKIILPAIISWIITKIIIFILFIKMIKIIDMKENILLNIMNNFIFSLLIVYLYRFYMLKKKNIFNH